jgi:S-disulfanyl-L-cysteine oxidoreductase SoxD
MSKFLRALTSALLLSGLIAGTTSAQTPYIGIGRTATQKEVRAWDIDVRPDFKGLPAGSGSVAKGQEVWEAKCASCHGIFGESNQVFSPLVGGTTKDDIRTGRVARLLDDAYPGRTTLMKLSSLSTLWDYISRAMPWTQPKSLSVDEVYAVTAFMLNLGGIVPDQYVLSNTNMEQTQKLLPNRKGMTVKHSMWPGKLTGTTATTDYQGSSCMKDCKTEAKITSFLPDFARNAHGNLADQNRLVGAQRGAVTTTASSSDSSPTSASRGSTTAAATLVPALSPSPGTISANAASAELLVLLGKHSCVACHGMETKLVGPSFLEVTKKYSDKADAVDYLAGRIKAGGSGVWGAIPMPAQGLSEDEAKRIARWLVTITGNP